MTNGGPGTLDALLRAPPLPRRLPLPAHGLRLGAGLGPVRDHPGAYARSSSRLARRWVYYEGEAAGEGRARARTSVRGIAPRSAGGPRAVGAPAPALARRVGRPAACTRRWSVGGCPSLLPFLWMLHDLAQAEPEVCIESRRAGCRPTPRWEQLPGAPGRCCPFGDFLRNTLIITVLATWSAQLLSCALVAYGFARLRFRGRGRSVRRPAGDDDAAAAGDAHPALHPLPPARLARHASAADRAGLLRRHAFYIFLLRQFFLTLPTRAGRRRASRRRQRRCDICWHIIAAAVEAGAGDGRHLLRSCTTGTTSSGRSSTSTRRRT